MSLFCAYCGWHPCRCQDWRMLERQRVASGVHIYRVTWTCNHDPHNTSGPTPPSNVVPMSHPFRGPSFQSARRLREANGRS